MIKHLFEKFYQFTLLLVFNICSITIQKFKNILLDETKLFYFTLKNNKMLGKKKAKIRLIDNPFISTFKHAILYIRYIFRNY